MTTKKSTKKQPAESTPAMDAADMLSALVKDRSLPEELRYKIGVAITNGLTSNVDLDSPEMIRAMLRQYRIENGGEGR